MQRRSFAARFELRDTPSGGVGLRGYAAMFDQVAYGEVIRRGAFTKTLAEGDDVRMLINHDGVPLARTKSGTLTLEVDDKGLL
ncbi:HK97 family phage prohead protease, partial [Lacticaseibacillus paracasei]